MVLLLSALSVANGSRIGQHLSNIARITLTQRPPQRSSYGFLEAYLASSDHNKINHPSLWDAGITGYRPGCLLDKRKTANQRLTPLLGSQLLKREMERHYKALEKGSPMRCGPHCDLLFDWVSDIQHHNQDIHCIPMPKQNPGCKPKSLDSYFISPKVKSNTSADFAVHITTPGGHKRKYGSSDKPKLMGKRRKHIGQHGSVDGNLCCKNTFRPTKHQRMLTQQMAKH
ncbi:predicted protein [Histoplasma capsulatum var. duboisii H88]|uniref:Predicted protein n=1 Tax=Ajellomyces capsulatus (strain H88) TaxID=544711 RepID=F0UAB8_AJEC8|nr:predicted protein [Histoplasma capsulatum var. duboisii H88]